MRNGKLIVRREEKLFYAKISSFHRRHSFWQYNVFNAFSSSIKALFWSSRTATLCSKHLMYSFFFRRHSLAASLRKEKTFTLAAIV